MHTVQFIAIFITSSQSHGMIWPNNFIEEDPFGGGLS